MSAEKPIVGYKQLAEYLGLAEDEAGMSALDKAGKLPLHDAKMKHTPLWHRATVDHWRRTHTVPS